MCVCAVLHSLAFSEAGIKTPSFLSVWVPNSLPRPPPPATSDPLPVMIMGDTDSFLNQIPQEMPCDPLCPACQNCQCGPADHQGLGWLQLQGKWPGVWVLFLAEGWATNG